MMALTRSDLEKREHSILAPFAVWSGQTLGRIYKEEDSNTRTGIQRDRDRVIHSKAFRRLKHKTQVFVAGEGDHYRTRLTHTLEVAQIARHIARLLQLNEDLAETIAYAHDLGHPPFAHAGEKALEHLMEPYGGFEHNGQSHRIVTTLEDISPLYKGLNLTYETLFGLLKHATLEAGQKIYPKFYLPLESAAVDMADEIAYNNHDLDDGLSSGLLNHADLYQNVPLWKEATDINQKKYTALSSKELTHLNKSYLINLEITVLVQNAETEIKTRQITTLEDLRKVSSIQIVKFPSEMAEKIAILKRYLMQHFYRHPKVVAMNEKGTEIISGLFHYYMKNQEKLADYGHASDDFYRRLADYIAGMTDGYATGLYEEIRK
jgi:dGTPase